MNKLQQYAVLTVVGVVAVLAAGWFLLISPERSQVAALNDSVTSAQSQGDGLRMQLARLRSEAKMSPQDQKELAAIASKLPPNPALPDLIHDLTGAAASAGVDLQVIAPSHPTPLTPGASSAGTMLAPATSGGSASAATASAGSLYQIQVNLTVVGGYFQIEKFVQNLEHLRRAFVCTIVDVVPGDPLNDANANVGSGVVGSTGTAQYTGKLTANITGNVFELQTSGSGAMTLPTTPAAGNTSGATTAPATGGNH